MTGFDSVSHLLYLLAAVCFVAGLHLMRAPQSARRGNAVSAVGMSLAVLVTLVSLAHGDSTSQTSAVVLGIGLVLGGTTGALAARRVAVTSMPQLVSLFNAVGGAAAALVAGGEALGQHALPLSLAPVSTTMTAAVDVLIGSVTVAGSLVAAGKLAGRLPGRPMGGGFSRAITAVLAAFAVGLVVLHVGGHGGVGGLVALALAGLVIGSLVTAAIGGADMPVVISLLNACTGTAVAMAGFVIDSVPLIIAGGLVGAAGGVLTALMARAMNRSVLAVLRGGFGTDDAALKSRVGGGAVRTVDAADAALQLAYAHRVVIVPGFGLAAAQAQHEVVALAAALTAHGVDVTYAIHPVAGRMPGHMNVLLAEADAPYAQMRDLEEANAELPSADVALVVGANDVTNPAAHRSGNAVSGMPVLDVDRARSVIVVKRSLGHGYAGIDNELYTEPCTAMLFGDAKQVLDELQRSLRSYVS
jgi:NAD(P) transhydrogenase subunit beta